MSTLTVQRLWESPDNPIIRIPSKEETEELISFLRSRWIGFIAEASRPVPPGGYGGGQYVIDDLNRFLRTKGINTVFFGTADSTVEATEKVPLVPSAVLEDGKLVDKILMDAADLIATTWLKEWSRVGRLHLANLHTPYIGPQRYLEEIGVPILLTPHWEADGEWNGRQTSQIVTTAGGGVVFLSKSQMGLYGEGLNTLGVVHNPVDIARIEPVLSTPSKDGAHLAFLGRCNFEKRPDLAARIAIAAGLRLKMVVQCLNTESRRYYREVVEPIIASPEGKRLIDCQVKEIGYGEKMKLFRNASATLFPITWDEPFGLVPIESLASGTPVLAFNWGAMPELITPDVGCVVQVRERMMQTDNWDEIEDEAVREAASAVREVIPTIDRRRCRKYVKENFSLEVVGRRYLLLYAFLLGY